MIGLDDETLYWITAFAGRTTQTEGFVPVETLLDNHYNFDQRRMTLSGRRGRHSFRLGDAIRVRVSDINLSQRTLELEVL